MRMRVWAVAVLMGLGLLGGSGCTLDRALQDGLADGVTAASAAAIETPIVFWRNQIFAEQ